VSLGLGATVIKL